MDVDGPEINASRSQAPLRICFVLEASGGGAGRHVLDLSRAFTARGHHVHLIYSPVRAETIFLDPLRRMDVDLSTVVINRGIGPADLVSAWRVGRLLKRLGPFDIVHAHSSKAGAVLRLAPGRFGRIVYTPHAFRSLDPTASPLARKLFGVAEVLLAARTDAIILVSHDECAHARELGIPSGKLRVIRNSIAPLRARPRGEVRAELGVADDAVVVGFVGRFSHQKAPETFVATMDRVMERFPNLFAVMVGDGDLRGLVAGHVSRSRFADRFRLLGARPSQQYLAGFDMLLMTSRYEAMSYVMLEALAAHLPLVTTPVAGAGDIVEDGGNGIITSSYEAADIAAAVIRVVGDPALLARMSAKAAEQDRAVNGDRMVIETERLYQTLLGRR